MTDKAKAPALAPIELFYDYWTEDGERHKAGTVIEVTVAEAKAMIKAGKAERSDPFPGE